MKRYIRSFDIIEQLNRTYDSDRDWYDPNYRWNEYPNIPSDVEERLAECESIKEDLPILVNARWAYLKYKGKDTSDGLTKEDAFVDVSELLDSNGQWQLADVTQEEYADLVN